MFKMFGKFVGNQPLYLKLVYGISLSILAGFIIISKLYIQELQDHAATEEQRVQLELSIVEANRSLKVLRAAAMANETIRLDLLKKVQAANESVDTVKYSKNKQLEELRTNLTQAKLEFETSGEEVVACKYGVSYETLNEDFMSASSRVIIDSMWAAYESGISRQTYTP